MTPILVFVHGWGLDAGFWAPLRRALPEAEAAAVDLGFTGTPCLALPEGRRLVLVGHSLGFAWALRQPVAWTGLVSIGGFARFAKAADFANGTPVRVIERMRARLLAEPHSVWRDFLRRCGGGGAACDTLDAERLARGLDWLAAWDERAALAAARAPLLALAAEDDAIVPAAMARDSFPEACLRLTPGGGHLLPSSAPAWCAGHIRDFLSGLP